MAAGKKRKVAEKSSTEKTDGVLAPHMLPENRMFLSIDLNSKGSIQAHVPLVDGKGTAVKVPEHILGHDTTFSETLWKIRQFRELDQSGQRKEAERWSSMSKREKALHYSRKNHLIEQQRQKRGEKDSVGPSLKRARTAGPSTRATSTLPTTASATAPQTTTTATGSSNELPAAATTSMITPNPASNVSNGVTTRSRSQRPQRAPEQATAITTTTMPPPPLPPTNTTRTLSHLTGGSSTSQTGTVEQPSEPLGDMTNVASSANDNFVGLVHSKQVRQNVMPTARDRGRKKGKVNRNRKIGLPCQSTHQQADTKSMESVNRAIAAVATACDTTSLPGRPRHAPGQKLVLFILNEVKETAASGGGSNQRDAGSWRSERPKLTVVSTSARDIRDISIAIDATLKHRQPTNS